MSDLEQMRLLILGNKTDTSKDDIFNIMLSRANFILLNLLYPYHEYRTGLEAPSNYSDWIVRCAIELYGNLGEEGFISYSENQLSWSKEKSGISKDLMLEITSYAYVPTDAEE